MLPLCPDGFISLGYIGDYFPIFFKDGAKFDGVSVRIFEDVAWRFNCSTVKLIEFKKYRSLAAVQRGEILTDITTDGLSTPRMKEFHYSLSLYVDTYSFYEATNHVTSEAWTPLIFFIVYQPWTLLLIFICLILIRIVTEQNDRLKTGFGLWIRYAASGMFLSSILVLIILHGAVFKGNTIYPSAASVTSWPDLLTDLLKGKRELFEAIENLQINKQDQLLGEGKRTTVTGSVDATIDKMCAHPRKTAGLLYAMEIYSARLHGIPSGSCQLQRINPIPGEFTYKYPPTPHIYSYFFSKKASRKVIEYVNFLTLTLYSDDNVDFFWTSRLLPSIKQKPTTTEKYRTRPVTVASLGVWNRVVDGSLSGVMLPLCPDGFISLGYIGDYFPIFFKDGAKFNGISILIFEDVAWRFNCTSLKFIQFQRYRTLAAIKRGEILTDVTSDTFTAPRIKKFQQSLSLYADTYSFYEATNHVTGEAWTPLIFFIVYQPWTLLLIFLIVTERNERLKTGFGLWMRYAASGMFLSSFLVLINMHGAVFKGNTIYPSAASITSWPELLADLLRGKRQLFEAIEDLQVFKQEQLLGEGKRTTVTGSVDSTIDRMCAHPRKTAGIFYEMEIYTARLHGSLSGTCKLQSWDSFFPSHLNICRIEPIPGEFSYKYPPTLHIFGYFFSTNTSQKVINYVNFLTLSIYSDDNVDFFWSSRLLPRLKQKPSVTEKLTTRPVTVASLGWIFTLFATFHLLSISSFVCEFLVIRFHRKR